MGYFGGYGVWGILGGMGYGVFLGVGDSSHLFIGLNRFISVV
jgi:hypothetical protein